MSGIRECPACGCDEVKVMSAIWNDEGGEGVASCPACAFQAVVIRPNGRHGSEALIEAATRAWNTRPTEDALRAEVESYRASLRECQQFLAELTGPARPGEQLLNWLARCLEVECRARAALQPKGDGG